MSFIVYPILGNASAAENRKKSCDTVHNLVKILNKFPFLIKDRILALIGPIPSSQRLPSRGMVN
jgi:hypothetical protein